MKCSGKNSRNMYVKTLQKNTYLVYYDFNSTVKTATTGTISMFYLPLLPASIYCHFSSLSKVVLFAWHNKKIDKLIIKQRSADRIFRLSWLQMVLAVQCAGSHLCLRSPWHQKCSKESCLNWMSHLSLRGGGGWLQARRKVISVSFFLHPHHFTVGTSVFPVKIVCNNCTNQKKKMPNFPPIGFVLKDS